MDAYDGAPSEALLHRLLLSSGGLLPAQNVADARFALARGDLRAAVANVADGLRVTGAALPGDDRELLTGLGATGLDEAADPPAGPPHTYEPVDPDAVPAGTWIPPVVDLTV